MPALLRQQCNSEALPFQFTANSATTTLRFTNIGLGNNNADTLVDTVSVVLDRNLLANADFETAPFNTIGTVSDWNVGGTGIVADRSDEGSAGGDHSLDSM